MSRYLLTAASIALIGLGVLLSGSVLAVLLFGPAGDIFYCPSPDGCGDWRFGRLMVGLVLFMAGAGGSLRAGVTENPVRLTHSVKQALTRVTAGGAACYVWPGGGITYMVDVTALPENAFGSVPTPALVAPIEFTMTKADYAAMGGHMDQVRSLESVLAETGKKRIAIAE